MAKAQKFLKAADLVLGQSYLTKELDWDEFVTLPGYKAEEGGKRYRLPRGILLQGNTWGSYWHYRPLPNESTMREYNSATDYSILQQVARDDAADQHARGLLCRAKQALEAAGISWPRNFNTCQKPSTLAIDRDLGQALEEIRRT